MCASVCDLNVGCHGSGGMLPIVPFTPVALPEFHTFSLCLRMFDISDIFRIPVFLARDFTLQAAAALAMGERERLTETDIDAS